jgi:hypothetical protein
MKYFYFINYDERGGFCANVQDESGANVFDIKAGDELPEGETSIFDNGYMKHKNDLAGLESYLKDLGVIHPAGYLMRGN